MKSSSGLPDIADQACGPIGATAAQHSDLLPGPTKGVPIVHIAVAIEVCDPRAVGVVHRIV